MAQGEFTKQEVEETSKAVEELFNAIPKSRRYDYIGHINDIFLFLDAAKVVAPDENNDTEQEGQMRFLSNTYDPKRADAKTKVGRQDSETLEQAWQRKQEWLSDKLIAAPQATEHFTVAELVSLGMVGVYAHD